MKKVLVLFGSARKVDTWNAVHMFEEKIRQLGEVEFDYLLVRDLNLRECTGCHNCFIKGREFCFEREKVAMIVNRIKESDGVIIASPVYNQHITALLKKNFDFMTYLWHRPEFFGIPFMGISSGGGMFQGVFKYMAENVNSWGGNWIFGFGIPHLESLTDKFKAKVTKELEKKATIFYEKIQQRSFPAPSIGRLMYFNIWKLNAEVCKEALPTDYEYWKEKDWLKSDFYYKTHVIFYKKILIGLLMKMTVMFMRSVYKGY